MAPNLKDKNAGLSKMMAQMSPDWEMLYLHCISGRYSTKQL
jgi:hypothetical protein